MIGVRHHSPACARLVAARIRALRPSHVLIEGPADMNERLDEFLLGHHLPIAAFSFRQSKEISRAAWSPFCAYSPEWVALEAGREVGADVRFIDLPAWQGERGNEGEGGGEESEADDEDMDDADEPTPRSRRQDERINRYSDAGTHYSAYVDSLCREFGIEGMDNLWDHLFEQPLDDVALEERLATYFANLRADLPAGRDAARERFMNRFIAWAMRTKADDGLVMVVCGGWHKRALETEWMECDGALPELPTPPDEERYGTYLVPYSDERMDSFTGYQSGMPSPNWHRYVWRHGAEGARERVLEHAVSKLRSKKVSVSASDLISATGMTEGLMRLRGHGVPTRADLLDGLASALLDEAQPERFPWNERAGIRRDTDPRLALVLEVMRGETRGRLADGTPVPPLVEDVERALRAHEGVLGKLERSERRVPIELTREDARQASAVLHRLRVLGVPGFARIKGPDWATDGELGEEWALRDHLDRRAALIEASIFGGTMALATREKLRRRAGDVSELVSALGDAVFCDLPDFARTLIQHLGEAARNEGLPGPLSAALSKLLALYRHDVLFGVKDNHALGELMEAVADRLLWLLEGLVGEAPDNKGAIGAVFALREMHRHTSLGDESRANAVMARRLKDPDAPPVIVGAALGYLWSEAQHDEEALRAKGETISRADAIRVMRGFGQPARLGPFLHGLFALARAEVREDADVVEALDDMIGVMEAHDFFVALPTLRLAFSEFPIRERGTLAKMLVSRHGPAAESFTAPLTASLQTLQRSAMLEAAVDAMEAQEGLAPLREDAP